MKFLSCSKHLSNAANMEESFCLLAKPSNTFSFTPAVDMHKIILEIKGSHKIYMI